MELTVFDTPQQHALWRVTSCGRQRIAPGRPYWYDNRHRAPIEWVVVQITLAGQIVYRDQHESRTVGPGQLVIFALAEASSYGLPGPSDEPYECQWVNMRGAGLREHLDALRRQHGSVLDLGPRRTLQHEMDQLMALVAPNVHTTPTDHAAVVHQFVMHLFEHAEQRLYETLSPVQRAVQQIMRDPTQPWSLKELAGDFGCSREHLTRVFHEHTGQTPAAYLAQARLQRALQLIMQTDMPIQAIAEQSGFTSVHTLARQVRTATGLAPTEVRKRSHRPITLNS